DRARAHSLDVTRPDDRACSRTVLVLQGAGEHIGHDLHVAVAVRREPLTGLHAVLVDHAQIPEAPVLRVVVVREREGVARVEPAVVGAAPLLRAPDDNHVDPLEWRPADRDSELPATFDIVGAPLVGWDRDQATPTCNSAGGSAADRGEAQGARAGGTESRGPLQGSPCGRALAADLPLAVPALALG